MRVPSFQLFTVDGHRLAARLPVEIRGVQLTTGVWFDKNEVIGGLRLTSLLNRDLEVQIDHGVYVINKLY